MTDNEKDLCITGMLFWKNQLERSLNNPDELGILEKKNIIEDIQRIKTFIDKLNRTHRKKIFIICTVRGATDEYKRKLEGYVIDLENKGYHVHLPHRDTNQEVTGLQICTQNYEAILNADEVHIFYNSSSQGTHFDMGMAFALSKKIVIVENESYGEGKSFPRMLAEWEGWPSEWER